MKKNTAHLEPAKEKDDEPLSSHDLLADLILIQCGWRTESEHERYLAANSRIMKAGRKIHLQAELDSLGQRQSAPTGAQEPEFKQGADRPLGDASCCASSIPDDAVQVLDTLFRRNGVGSVELRGGKLRFSFGHCVIGVVVSGDTPRLSSWVEKSGLLTENQVIRNFDIGYAVKTYRESGSLGEMVEEDVRVAVNHPSPKPLDIGVVEGGVS